MSVRWILGKEPLGQQWNTLWALIWGECLLTRSNVITNEPQCGSMAPDPSEPGAKHVSIHQNPDCRIEEYSSLLLLAALYSRPSSPLRSGNPGPGFRGHVPASTFADSASSRAKRSSG